MIKQTQEQLKLKIKKLEEEKKTLTDKVAIHYMDKRIELAKMFLKQREDEDKKGN